MLTRDAKYGWEIARKGKRVSAAKVLTWDRGGPSPDKIVAVSVDTGAIYTGCVDGLALCDASGERVWDLDLRDAPAPKASGTDWIVRWSCENGYTRSAALHHTEIAAVALANFLRETGRTHVSVTRADWEDGQGLQPAGGR